mgnify:CR=1 FL=1
MTDLWSIWVDDLEKWMVEGYTKLPDGTWKERHTLYGSKRRAQSDAKLFNKDSSHTYVAKEYKNDGDV